MSQGRQTRIDSAHLVRREGEQAAEDTPVEAVAVQEVVSTPPRQVQAQADQLAAFLRSRQRDLDRREAQVNARCSQLDSETRCARLTPVQRDQPTASDEKLLQMEAAWEELEQTRQETLSLQQHLHGQRKKLEDEARAERQRLVAQQRASQSELARQQALVARRAEYVDRSQAALEQLRSELGQAQRETLEIRLATEELWAQLSGAAPPAALAESLAQIRRRLDQQHQCAEEQLDQQRRELETVRGELAEQYQRLVCQKQRQDTWAKRREEVLAQQAARLAAREKELSQQAAAIEGLTERHQLDQLGSQTEIRRLKTRLSA